MVLYLLRHGKAARQDPDGPRSLTSTGREEVARVAGYFKKKASRSKTFGTAPKPAPFKPPRSSWGSSEKTEPKLRKKRN